MNIVQESRERQRLYVPTRTSLRVPGKAPADPWQPKGQMPDYTPDPGYSLRNRAVILALVGACNLLLASVSPVLQVAILLVDVVGLVVLFDTVNKLFYAFWNRKPLLRWITFPVHTGERLEAVLVARPSPEAIGPVLAVLRCVRDDLLEGEGRVPMAIYSLAAEFDVPGVRLTEIALAFEVPPDLPGTDLDRDDAVYWQIAVRIPMIGPDLEYVYLAPVYDASAAPR